MQNSLESWKFTCSVDPERRKRLYEAPPFEEIAEAIRTEMCLTSFNIEQSCDRRDFRRPEFKLNVGKIMFDLFYNSPTGYRAQYYLCPENGERRNRSLIDKISPRLLEFAFNNMPCTPGLTTGEIEKSLNMESAKIWIYEGEQCILCNEIMIEINVSTWVEAAENELEKLKNGRLNCMEIKAIYGVRALYGERLEVKGAFVNKGCEWDPKCGKRSEQIHRFGFT